LTRAARIIPKSDVCVVPDPYPDQVDRLRKLLVSRRDWLLAGGLFLFGLAELLLAEQYQGRPAWPGRPLAALVQVCVFTWPLAWRRRAPATSSLTILVGAVATSLLWGAAESTTAFLSLLLAIFSGIAYARRPYVVGVVGGLALAAHNAADPSVVSVVDWFWSAGFLAVAALLGAAVRGRQLRIVALQQDADAMSEQYEERVAAATAAERAMIARELHDVVAHAVSVIVIQAQAGARAVEDDPHTTRALLGTIETTGRSALADLRRLLRLLDSHNEDPVDPSPGLAHLPELVQGFRAGGLRVSLQLPDPLPTLSGTADLAAYRLVQEALTNTLRHAAGADAAVVVTRQANLVEVLVEDDGRACSPGSTLGAGRGLIGMRERVSLAGGTLRQSGGTSHGFRIRAELPLPEATTVEVAG
jgi:signal transduction histidine kinase